MNVDWGDTGVKSTDGAKIPPVVFQRQLNSLYALDEKGHYLPGVEQLELTGVLDSQTIEFTRKLLQEKYAGIENGQVIVDGLINKLVSTQSVENNLINDFKESENKNIMGE